MIIGVPSEIKNNENRVALTPAGLKIIQYLFREEQVKEVDFQIKNTLMQVVKLKQLLKMSILNRR